VELGILVLSGPGEGSKQRFNKFPISLGRYPGNDIVITDNIVSRRHAVLAIEGDDLTLIDLDSMNGTYVNGSRVLSTLPIVDNDLIVIGRTELRISICK
jgi:pSer/pThr/pTyr-binding forkhead associated (FHA) protein